MESAAREAGAPAEQAAVRKIKNIRCCHNLIFSNLLLLKIPALSTALPSTFSMPLAAASVHLAAKNAKVFNFFNAFQLPGNVPTPFFYTTFLLAMMTSSDSSCF